MIKKLKPLFFSAAVLLPLLLLTGFMRYDNVPPEVLSHEKAGEAAMLKDNLASNPYDYDTLMELLKIYMSSGNYRSVIESAKAYLEYIAGADGFEKEESHALVMIGQSFLALNMPDSMQYYFEEGRPVAEKANSVWAISAIQNGLGINALTSGNNYHKVLSYFMEGLEYVENMGSDSDLSIPILNNIAYTYYLKGDTLGLKYSLQVYEKAKADDNPYLIISGALTSAYMYYLKGDYDKALLYVEEAYSMSEDYHDKSALYSTYGNILSAMGKSREAEELFKKAISYVDVSDAPSSVTAYESYGKFLLSGGRYSEAITAFEHGIANARKSNIYTYRYKLYQGISDAYESVGNDTEALRYYKIYREEADSIFNIEREHSFNELMMKYETEKRQKEIQEREMELFRERKKLEVIILLFAIVAGLAAMIYILYRRKNRMYREIVKQHHDYVQKIKRLDSGYIKKDTVPVSGDRGERSQTAERDRELFGKIEKAMREDRAYTDNEISIDKLAELVGSNRSYVSRIINEYAGMSFNNYINSFRIDQAVNMLSDINCDKPMNELSEDLGYNTLSTFYRSFQKSIGVPPSRYRNEYRKLYGEKLKQ